MAWTDYQAFRQTLSEGKQRHYLYHLIGADAIIYSLKHDRLDSGRYPNISLTRDRMLNHYLGSRPNTLFKLELDGELLADRYRIRPYRYQSLDEAEEVVVTQSIQPLSSYLTKVILMQDVLEQRRRSGDELWPDPLWVRHSISSSYYESFPDLLAKVKQLSPEPLYVQSNTTIRRDPAYISKLLQEPVAEFGTGYAIYQSCNVPDERDADATRPEFRPVAPTDNPTLDEPRVGKWPQPVRVFTDYAGLPDAEPDPGCQLFLVQFEYPKQAVDASGDVATLPAGLGQADDVRPL